MEVINCAVIIESNFTSSMKNIHCVDFMCNVKIVYLSFAQIVRVQEQRIAHAQLQMASIPNFSDL